MTEEENSSNLPKAGYFQINMTTINRIVEHRVLEEIEKIEELRSNRFIRQFPIGFMGGVILGILWGHYI